MFTLLQTAIVAFISFIAGYVVARLDAIYVALTNKNNDNSTPYLMASTARPATTSKKQQEEIERKVAAVSIDTSTVVTAIKTDNIEKVTDIQLGTTTVQTDTLTDAVSRLSQLKGN